MLPDASASHYHTYQYNQHQHLICRDIVLEAGTDEFYRQHMYHNYGDVGVGVKELVDKFSASTAQHKQV